MMRFIPFEAMTMQEQRAHLRQMHGWGVENLDFNQGSYPFEHARDHRRDVYRVAHDAEHTHDKPLGGSGAGK